MSKFDVIPDPTTNVTCIRCKGGLTGNGYGHFYKNGKDIGAHRAAYEEAFGPIPTGMLVMHTCNNKWCINPDHLELGTEADNARHYIESGGGWRGQRTNRKTTAGKILPKGISYHKTSGRYACNIRVGKKRYQTTTETLQQAIEWRQRMEAIHWNTNYKDNNDAQAQGNDSSHD